MPVDAATIDGYLGPMRSVAVQDAEQPLQHRKKIASVVPVIGNGGHARGAESRLLGVEARRIVDGAGAGNGKTPTPARGTPVSAVAGKRIDTRTRSRLRGTGREPSRSVTRGNPG